MSKDSCEYTTGAQQVMRMLLDTTKPMDTEKAWSSHLIRRTWRYQRWEISKAWKTGQEKRGETQKEMKGDMSREATKERWRTKYLLEQNMEGKRREPDHGGKKEKRGDKREMPDGMGCDREEEAKATEEGKKLPCCSRQGHKRLEKRAGGEEVVTLKELRRSLP